ncbi:uncharacterized protein LOC131954202 [Physella acuta]|uniref:uncharacterized protein LOC131954202 n=1 Tax=Physella acuta TaxID=109671 RepID=UPI0027DD8CCA|nr:uncharacterized protein LOC131954202 [Physella acuta]XP_059173738.1 uncharacterized protein LOC131954202 [Physella acuta]
MKTFVIFALVVALAVLQADARSKGKPKLKLPSFKRSNWKPKITKFTNRGISKLGKLTGKLASECLVHLSTCLVSYGIDRAGNEVADQSVYCQDLAKVIECAVNMCTTKVPYLAASVQALIDRQMEKYQHPCKTEQWDEIQPSDVIPAFDELQSSGEIHEFGEI